MPVYYSHSIFFKLEKWLDYKNKYQRLTMMRALKKCTSSKEDICIYPNKNALKANNKAALFKGKPLIATAKTQWLSFHCACLMNS